MGQNRLLCALLLAAAMKAAPPADPVVAVAGGRIQGQTVADGGVVFKGVPFARPPVGDLRWREPQPVQPWKGIRETNKFRPACTQLSEGWNIQDVTGSTEDCLYLNVAAPQWPPKAPLPVMVWIHGGSNTAGSGEAGAIERGALVKHGFILVTINYRLGALGFMAHPGLVRESPHHSSGNYGLLDQIAALRWVRDNVKKFGGDPGNVTVAGESAGAYDIGLLLTSPLAKGLFRRGIEESGAVPCFNGSLTAERAQEIGRRLAAELKAPEGDEIRHLRKIPPEEILKAARIATGGDRSGLETSVDGWVLPEPPADVFMQGRSLPVPLIIGTNAQETGGPQPAAELRERIRKTYGNLANQALALYGLAGDGEGQTDPLYGPPGRQWFTDFEFRCPSAAQTLWHAEAGNPTYEYEFEHPQPGQPAQSHAGELPFLFGTWPENVHLSPIDEQISEQMRSYWANFVRTGDPNGEGLPIWPRFEPDSQKHLAFTDNGAAAKPDTRRKFCEVFIEYWKARSAKPPAE
jgi:para-nitrobenzyl esterase